MMASEQGDGELLGGLPATGVPADQDPCLISKHLQTRVFLSNHSSIAAVLIDKNTTNSKFYPSKVDSSFFFLRILNHKYLTLSFAELR